MIIPQEEANLVRMQISWPKTKLMVTTHNLTNHLSLNIYNKEVQFVDYFTYVGSLITNDGSYSRDIKSRIAKAASAMCRLSTSLFLQTPHQHTNQDRHESRLRCHNPRRSPSLRRVRHALPKSASCVCSAWQQHISNRSVHERTKEPTARIISPMITPPTLVRASSPHAIPVPVRRVYDFDPLIRGWKRPRGRLKTRWADSVKHDLHSAGLDTSNAVQIVFDRPQWKAFVSGLPTLEPEQGS